MIIFGLVFLLYLLPLILLNNSQIQVQKERKQELEISTETSIFKIFNAQLSEKC